jgi:NADH-quinone oxidoreductase subunit N
MKNNNRIRYLLNKLSIKICIIGSWFRNNLKYYWLIFLFILFCFFMFILNLTCPDIYNHIYYNYIIKMFELILIIPELLYFVYIIYFIIQYLIIEKEAILKSILETIIFLTFALIPTFYSIIENYKNKLLLKNIWLISSEIYLIKLIVLISFIMVLILISIEDNDNSMFKSEVILLLLLSVFGLLLTISFNDFVLMILCLELSSLSIYILCGLKKESNKAMEAAWKYFLYNSVSTLIMVFGITLIYILLGTLNYIEITKLLFTEEIIINNNYLYNFSLLLILVGFLFKLVMFPFWWWLEEVYEGLSIIIIFYLTIVPKLAYVYLFYIIMFKVFVIDGSLINILIILSIITLILSSIYGLYQRKIRKLLAYSSISHMVFIIIPILIDQSIFGLLSSIYYFIIYVIINLLLFSTIIVIKRKYFIELNEILDFIFLKHTNRFLNLCLCIALLSSAGIPPFCGFYAKFWVFVILIYKKEYFIYILFMLCSLINVIYYIRLIRWMYFSNEIEDEFKIQRKKISFYYYLLITIFLFINIFFIFIQVSYFYLIISML